MTLDPGLPKNIEIPDKPATFLLTEAVEKLPDNPAINFFGRQLTYRGFDALVQKLMNVLRGLGVKPGDRVAIMAPNCPQALIAYQAILRVGAVVVQTNPLFVERELETLFNDSRARVVFVLNLFAPKVEAVIGKTPIEKVVVMKLEDFMPWPISWLFPLKMMMQKKYASVKTGGIFFKWRVLMDAASDNAKPADVSPDDLALVQYTGGTTGAAKGVALTHSNVLANALQCKSWFVDSEYGREVFLLAIPIFHAFGMTAGMNFALSLAANIVLTPKFDADGVMKLIEKHRATIFPGVPAMYVAINNHPNAVKRDISSIKYCISGAASLAAEVKKRFEELTGGKLVEGYGLTEASPVTHCNPLLGGAKVGSIGLPLPGTKAKIVLSDDGEEAPTGQVGELIVHGPQVMKGYYNRPEETEKVLKNHWLFTGDMGYADEEGFVYLMDRKKELIISGGCNVYPKEVEEILYQHPGVKEAAVIGLSDDYLGEKTIAVIVPKDGVTLTESEIIAWCKKSLAAFKTPKKVIFRQTLPKTVIGKVLKRILKKEIEEGKRQG